MDRSPEALFETLGSKDDGLRYEALTTLLGLTETRVDWFDGYAEPLFSKLGSDNSYQRSIGVMLLCNLAKSCAGGFYEERLEDILALTEDEKFITQRQCLQNLWKIAADREGCRDRILERYAREFEAAPGKKHGNLLRADIIASLAALNDRRPAPDIPGLIERLLASESDEKQLKALRKILKRN